MDSNFKVPSTVPQDLRLIQDLIGSHPIPIVTNKHALGPSGSSDDSIASTDSEAESEDEVEAGLTFRDDDSGTSVATSDSALPSDSELDASSSSDSEEGGEFVAPQRQKLPDDTEDEESAMAAPAAYLQTKNEIVEPNIMIPTISEVEPCDTLEKVGEIMSIIGNIVVVRGLPVDHINSLSERALDAESLLVFEDRNVLGYIYETFGPTSQPLYQVKFNEHYPLDTDKVRLFREVFHVPQRSHFVFVNQLKKLRGTDASNIHDEEPAEDEIEFSDDEKEAAFRAQRKRRRGQSMSSRQSTPAPSRAHIDDMAQDTYHSSNPYDAHGPYDDDYHVTGPPRPPPIPYDDPYADIPTSDARDLQPGVNGGGGEPNHESGDGPRVSHRRTFNRARGAQNRQSWGTTGRGHRHKVTTPQRTFDSGPHQSHTAASRMVECARGYEQIGDAAAPHSPVQPPSNAWLSPAADNIRGYQQPFIQPHINPRFAAMFGLNLPSESAIPWVSQNAQDPTSLPHHWAGTWAMHGSTGPESEGDTYWPV